MAWLEMHLNKCTSFAVREDRFKGRMWARVEAEIIFFYPETLPRVGHLRVSVGSPGSFSLPLGSSNTEILISCTNSK